MDQLSQKNMEKYLYSSESIDWKHPAVRAKADELTRGIDNVCEKAKRCFEFVRDQIRHSGDYGLNPVTCKASEVLEYGTGFCYAKSHLLAALLRAHGVPAGLCYQRLTIENEQPPLSLHGLNAVYLPDIGWYRIDARGNKPGVNAQFSPPVEQTAFPVIHPEEANLPEIWPEPLPAILQLQLSCTTYQDVLDNLPDVELIKA
jgi:transglutaminase-like putative cysteine protease